jgi:hypothetical protein
VTPHRRGSIAALICLMLLGMAAAAPATEPAPPVPAPRVALGLLYESVDSLWLRGTWAAVNDARGHPVVRYEVALHAATIADTGIVAQASQIGRTRVFGIPRPLAGDTVSYWLEVVAVDERGVESPPGLSAVMKKGTPWTPPAAPDVQLDTIPADSLTMSSQGRLVGGSHWTAAQIEGAKLNLVVGDTATLCVTTWQDGVGLTKPVEGWQNSNPLAVLLEPDGGNCALLRALASEVLLPLEGLRFRLAISASP